MPKTSRGGLARRAVWTAAALVAGAVALLPAGPSIASSHREAPFITSAPKVDGTDFYMFRSYEAGRSDYVTFIACYQPLQDAYGGPNYFRMDPKALYEIHVDNNGDAQEDLTFQFRFQNTNKDLSLSVGDPGSEKTIPVPLSNIGAFGAGSTASLNVEETYTLTMVTGDRRTGTATPIAKSAGGTVFSKPHDNIGEKSIPDYDAYANAQITEFVIPGCPNPGRVFVGQRKDPFVVNLGETFDLVNYDPTAAPDSQSDDLADKNVTCLCIEIPIACLVSNSDPVIGAWTTASKRQARVINPTPSFTEAPTIDGGAWTQVSRLGMPLVNEVVIGLRDKDRFNASEPKDDGQFADYVTHPAFPELLQILFGVTAPNLFPRTDLVSVFLTGLDGANQPAGVIGSEMMRLNTAVAPTAWGSQNTLGFAFGDSAGYPNGRRPGDDVVDITLRVAMGALLDPADAPSNDIAYTDGALNSDQLTSAMFPYVVTPIPGSPNDDGPSMTSKPSVK